MSLEEAATRSNLCCEHRKQGRLKEALAEGCQAVLLAPDNPDFLVNLSLVFTDLSQDDNAAKCLLRAIGVNHAHAESHLALAQILLARGDFNAGWREYEWRNLTKMGRETVLPEIKSAHWNGMEIPNGRILLIADQGYGDVIQFCRYIPMVAERCQEVILGCSAEMKPLMQRAPGVTHIHHLWAEIPPHVAHCQLSDLPSIFRADLSNIPATVPYLAANPWKQMQWGERLGELLGSRYLRVGLAWTGRATQPNNHRRSVPLVELANLSEVECCSFVSLQTAPAEPGVFPGLVDLSGELADFGDTAAIVANLDVVVSVCTSAVHLAGAMGKPTYVMLSNPCDWRWLIDRADSPWYPTAKLFRQATLGDWGPVIADVTNALTRMM